MYIDGEMELTNHLLVNNPEYSTDT